MGQRYRRMEDQKPGPGPAFNQEFAKGGGGLKLKFKNFPKMSRLGVMVSKVL